MTRRLAVCSMLLGLATSIAAAEPLRPSDFALVLPLEDVTEGLNAVELTEAVYRAAAHRSLADLRVFNAHGEALPLAILPALPPPDPDVRNIDLTLVALPNDRTVRDAALRAYALRLERDRTRTVIELRADEPTVARAESAEVGGYLIDARPLKDMKGRLVFDFAEQAPDFAGHAQVLGSDDLVNWAVLVNGPLAHERRLGDAVERARFELERPPAFLRLAWSGRPTPQLAGARFEQVIPHPASLPRSALATRTAENNRSLFVDVPPALPIERLYLRTPQLNQSLRVTVYRHLSSPVSRNRHIGVVPRRAPERWVPIATPEIFRVVRNGVEVEAPPVPFDGGTDRLRIDAEIPLPQPPPRVEAEWRPHRIAFAARAPGPYRIAVGNDEASAGPTLQLAQVLPGDDQAGTRLPSARIGSAALLAPVADLAVGRAERIAANAHWSRIALWAVLIAAIAGLAWMAWRIGAQLRRPSGQTQARQ